MPTIKVKINDAWRSGTVQIPNHIPVRKPLFKKEMEYEPEVAQVLIEMGYVTPLNSGDIMPLTESVSLNEPSKTLEITETTPPPREPKEENPMASVTTTTEVIEEDSAPEEDLEAKMIAYFANNTAKTIAKQIKWVGEDTAGKVKAESDLTIEKIQDLLSERQYEALEKYLEQK